MKALIQCLIDWLNENRSEANAWKILDALSRETLKRAGSTDPLQREFDVHELAQACQPEREWDYDAAKRWFHRAKVELFLEARQMELQAYFRGMGHLQALSVLQRKTTGRHRAPWYLHPYDIPIPEEIRTDSNEEYFERSGSSTQPVQTELFYDVTPPSDIKLSVFGRILLGSGTFVTKSARGAIWGVLMLCSVALLLYCGYLFWTMRLLQRPMLTSDLILTLMLIGATWICWRFFIRPWAWLLEDRIVFAGDLLCSLNEGPAQLDMAKDAKGKHIRIVRFSGVCPICAGRIELRYGTGLNSRRLFGCCEEAPHDHVFTFDRVTRIGRRYAI